MTHVKPKRRRVTLLSEVVNNHQQGESDVENRVKARLGTLTEPEKRDVADGGRRSEDGEGGEDKQGKRVETRQPPKKKITIRRNEDSLKNRMKRRADRQIYQPPAAKFKGASSRTGSQSESQEVGEGNNEMIENSRKEAKIQRNLLRTKRPRITFQSDEVDTNVAGGLKVKRRNLTDQSEERNVDKEEDGLASGVVKLNPLREESKQPAKPSYGKRQRGVGLRERLLQQSQKFAVGAASAAVGDENKEKETLPNSRDEIKEKELLPNSGETVLTTSSLREGLGNVHGEKVQHNLEEKEQSVVSSSGVRSGISEEKVVLSSVQKVEGNWLQEVKVDQLVEKPSSTTTTATSGDVSLSSDVHITPDSTNVPIPSAAVVPLVSTLIPTQLEKDGVDVKKDVEGRERKDSVTKRRLSIVDDEFAGLLDDVEVGEDEFNDEDDDDALLEELEDLINS
ncbi:hypothetical protein BSL78_14453 [Apostichopus japonicus]|uniref:Zinc finger CCCH domain-containing protein 11A n=1 Tax=Stichopus japonicus TaxID=307972 RepID=A0A2G8KL06_STIJA|nr:hypothetical protein BSL78_14453 [Apostichopus japonicus]